MSISSLLFTSRGPLISNQTAIDIAGGNIAKVEMPEQSRTAFLGRKLEKEWSVSMISLISGMTTSQIAALTTEQIKAMKPNDFKAMTKVRKSPP